jgi:hypothetical protein
MPSEESKKCFPVSMRKEAIAMAHALHENITESVREKNTASRQGITKGVISGIINAYVAENTGANGLTISADQERYHVIENHPEVEFHDRKPARDVHCSGGKFPLTAESELEGPKDFASDFKKVKSDPIDEARVTISRAKVIGGQGRHDNDIAKAAQKDNGLYIHTEIQLPHDVRSGTANFKTIAYLGNEKIFEIDTKDDPA